MSYAQRIGNFVRGIDVKKGIGYASKAINITRLLKQHGTDDIKDIANKIPIEKLDKLDQILGLADRAHDIIKAPARVSVIPVRHQPVAPRPLYSGVHRRRHLYETD